MLDYQFALSGESAAREIKSTFGSDEIKIFIGNNRRRFNRLPKRLLLFVMLSVSMILIYTKWNRDIEDMQNFEPLANERASGAEQFGNEQTLGERLEREVRVLCWVMTTPNNHRTKADYVLKTWGKRCNRLFFVTSELDDQLETIVLTVEDNYDVIWGKTKEAFKYIYDNYLEEADWFMKADDDTYVFVENLRYMLYPYSSELPIYFGFNFHFPHSNRTYMSGGSGYVLSKEALHRFATIGLNDPNKCRQENDHAEDLEMGICLSNLGVLSGDSRDNEYKFRFLPFAPFGGLLSHYNGQDYWYFDYSLYNPRVCRDCLSKYPVSFHYVTPEEMLMYDYFTDELNVYGIEQIEDTELPVKIDGNHLVISPSDNFKFK